MTRATHRGATPLARPLLRASTAVSLLLLAALPAPAQVESESSGHVIEGRILDAEASLERLRSGQSAAEDFYVPIADSDVRIELRDGGASFKARTDAEGRFRVDTGRASLPGSGLLVARIDRGAETLFSPSFRAGDGDVFVYPPSESAEGVTCQVGTVHDLRGVEGEPKRIRVRIVAFVSNRGSELYVGKRQGSPWREVLRVPIPPDAVVTSESGPVEGLHWRRSSDGRWMVIDEPVPGLPDLALQARRFGFRSPEDAERWWRWQVEYELPARQTLAFTYPLPVRCTNFQVYALKDRMKLVSGGDLSPPATFPSDPLTGGPGPYDAHRVRPGTAEFIEAGKDVLLALHVDNAAVGEISERALRWHGGFIVVSLVAILLGFVLSPRRPPPEAQVGGLEGEEVLDRIAALDRRFEAGKIPERDYRRYREALVEVASEEVQAVDEAAPGKTAAPAALSPQVTAILERLRELDRAESTSPAAIQERAHLLEALYKKLGGDGAT